MRRVRSKKGLHLTMRAFYFLAAINARERGGLHSDVNRKQCVITALSGIGERHLRNIHSAMQTVVTNPVSNSIPNS
jgi:hypothetical protein